MPPDGSVPAASGAAAQLARWAILLCLPLLLVGPALLPGRLFLPQLPVGFEPLASEYPREAERAWLGANYLASDAVFPILTDAYAMREQLSHGWLPLWEPRHGLGAPLAAQSLFGMWYPPHWLAFLVPPALAFGWIALLDLILVGAGMWAFLARRGYSFGACAIGALALQGGGFAFANLHYGMKLEAALWLPWCLWAIEGIAQRRAKSELALAGFTALSFLAGFPPVAIFCACAAALYAAGRRWIDRAREISPWRAWLFIALGAAAASIQLLPTWEASRESLRHVNAPGAAAPGAADALPLCAGATLVAPDLFGAPDEPVFAPAFPAAWWLTTRGERAQAENANLLEWNLFAGAAVIALAAAALLGHPRRSILPLVLLAASLGFAQAWPGFTLLYRLPGLSLGSPARAACVAWFAWAWLAALGAEALHERCRRAAIGAIAAASVLIAVGLALRFAIEPARWAEQLGPTLAARHGVDLATVHGILPLERCVAAAERLRSSGATLALFAAISLAAIAAMRTRSRWFALAVAIASHAAFAAWPHVRPREANDPLFPPSEAVSALIRAAGDGRVLRVDTSDSGVADVLALARPNLPQAYGIADLTPYVVFTPRRAVELLTALDPRAAYRSGASRISSPAFTGHRLLDVLHVTALLSRAPLEDPRLELAFERDDFHVYRRTNVPPLARMVSSAIVVQDDDAAKRALAQGLVDPARQTVVLADTRRGTASSGDALLQAVTWSRPRPDRFDVEVADGPGGWLAISEASYPGWRARLDDRPVPLARVDHACRGVWLEPGPHRLECEYRPASLWIGAFASALAAAAAVFLAARLRRSDSVF